MGRIEEGYKPERNQSFFMKGKSYSLSPFNFCHTLNDRMRSASLVIRMKSGGEDKRSQIYRDRNLEAQTEKFKNRKCDRPFLAIRKWKYWVYYPFHFLWYGIKCDTPADVLKINVIIDGKTFKFKYGLNIIRIINNQNK